MWIFYLILSSVSNQSFDLAGYNVNATDEIININVRTVKTIRESGVVKVSTPPIPPIHIAINIIGIIYLICTNHQFPIWVFYFYCSWSQSVFQLWIPKQIRGILQILIIWYKYCLRICLRFQVCILRLKWHKSWRLDLQLYIVWWWPYVLIMTFCFG